MDTNTEKSSIYTNIFKRNLAFTIDFFILAFLRIFAAQILGILWINKIASQLQFDFQAYFNSDIFDGSQEQTSFIVHHEAFSSFILFYILLILIGTFYHSYLNSSHWQATIGKRIMKIKMISENDERISFKNALAHYFLSIIPIVFTVYLLVFQASNHLTFIQALVINPINLIFGLIAIFWINIMVFNKKKKTAYDMICKINFVEGRSQNKFPW